MTARYLVGDVFDRMAELEDGSVDLILTSPPFLALRSYLPADHPDKAKEIGSEPTPAAFLDTLLALTAEWRRLLAPHGSIAVELGDTYSGSGGAGGDYAEGGVRENQPKFRAGTARWDGRPEGQVRTTTSDPVAYPARARDGWPLAKSLCGIPHLYHLSLAYGRNLLTGEPSPAGQWRVRNVVAWCRPNPPVGALGDKYRPATSYMTIACVSSSRYFDLDAVRTDHKSGDHHVRYPQTRYADTGKQGDHARKIQGAPLNPVGAPPLDWWEIPTQPYAGAHYATWPSALCERPIRSMVPQRVCLTCGEPSRRITGEVRYVGTSGGVIGEDLTDEAIGWSSGTTEGIGNNKYAGGGGKRRDGNMSRAAETTGWTDCGHDTWRPGTVLDPFAGSGTTLAVATGHGRDAIGIDLDARNADLARERVGMFLDVEYPEAVA